MHQGVGKLESSDQGLILKIPSFNYTHVFNLAAMKFTAVE